MTQLTDLVVDIETFYDSDYTLRKMTPAEYVLDSRFETIGVGLGICGTLPVWFSGSHEQIKTTLHKIDWTKVRVIAHNAMFDGSILEWIYGLKPARYLCTMMAIRPYVTPYTGRSDLGTVMKYLGLGEKGTEVIAAQGLRREMFSSEQLADYGRYCCKDVNGAGGIATWVSGKMAQDEQDLIDLTIKKFTRPQLCLDPAALMSKLSHIESSKVLLTEGLERRGIHPSMIRSRTKFAALLETRGVTVPKKISPRTSKETFAFSKLDVAFLELATHDDAQVRALVEARLYLASNMEETRLQRLLTLAALNFKGMCMLPVPLLYYGAHTGRFSGLDKINLQNLPRVKYIKDASGRDVVDPHSGALRRAIVAPEGYTIIAADLSNIEARIVATLAECWELVRAFRNGEDVYSTFATKIYGRPINKRDNPDERFVGKTCILGLGYGMGPKKFANQMSLAGRAIAHNEAQRIVYLYRNTYQPIPDFWSLLEGALAEMIDPKAMRFIGPLCFMHERILLPNGMPIIYPGLKMAGDGLAFRDRRSDTGMLHIWGGMVMENVTQALARIILTRAELRLARAGLHAALQVHDELIYCVRDRHVDAAKKAITMALTAPVDFLPHLPVAVEVKSGKSYVECK